jgi:photosystem II stability/assembly factor-like uncharacterized protein
MKITCSALLLLQLWGLAGAAEKIIEFKDNFYGLKILGSSAWVSGYYGTILFTPDKGGQWTIQKSGVDNALYGIDFIDQNNGWIAGAYGTILKTSNGGKSWKPIKSGIAEHLLDVDFVDQQNGWIVGSNGTILSSADGGESWKSQSIGQDVILNSVAFVGAKNGWVVGEFGVIFRTKDGGRNWFKQKSPIEIGFASGESRNLFRLILSGKELWAFGLDGTAVRSKDGEKWELAPLPEKVNKNKNHLFDAVPVGDEIWVVGQRGTTILGHRSSGNWTEVPLGMVKTLNAIDFGPDGWGLMVGNRGTIFKTENSGKKWGELRLNKS